MESETEEALMEAYVAGDAAAFERLFRTLAPSIHAFFVRSAGPAAADDLLQTTFLKIHGARGTWRRGERLRPWAFTIAARARIDWFRRHGRSDAEVDDDGVVDPDTSRDPAESLLARERAERLEAALATLREPQRAVIHLHAFEGLSFAEVGRILGASEGAVRVRAFRAYARLREALGDLAREERS
jgi:RNA polymerase sigma-70 factor (ECF subfamily)